MTINEYYQKLELADWHYQMSDDSNTYYRGRPGASRTYKGRRKQPRI